MFNCTGLDPAFLAGFLSNLPEVILAVIVIHAVSGLIKIKELKKVYALNKTEFIIAMVAVAGVLLFGILKGVLIAVVLSLVLLIRRLAYPFVPVLGKIGSSDQYSDISRHPDNTLMDGVNIQRIEASILYFNSGYIHERILQNMQGCRIDPRLLILDLSAVPTIDISGSQMLHHLIEEFKNKGGATRIVGALSNVRELLRKQGVETITGPINRAASIHDVVKEFVSAPMQMFNQTN